MVNLEVRVKKGQIGNFDPFGVEIAKTDIFPEISAKNYPGVQIFRIPALAVSPRPVGGCRWWGENLHCHNKSNRGTM